MATPLVDSSTLSEKSRISLFTPEQVVDHRAVDDALQKSFEALTFVNEQCQSCQHCPLSSALSNEPTPDHSKDMK